MKHWFFAAVLVLAACGDDEIIRGNNATNNGSNNANNTNNTNNASNNIVGLPCTTNEECVPPNDTCQGDVAVQYTGNGLCGSETGICNFFFVTERIDCTVTTQSCEAGTCVDNVCTNKVCETPADRCEGTVAVFYPDDSRCDVSTGACINGEARVDCAPQGAECIAGTCVGPVDLCLNVTCDTPPDPTCAGNTLSTYAIGVCDLADGMCDFPATTTDCTATGQVCLQGACTDAPDLCLNVVCDNPPAAVCNGDVLSTYANGVCNAADGSCSYAETTTDCTATGLVCQNGACVDPPLAAGDLTIVEVMLDPEAVDDTAGEWFEVINTASKTIDLNGLVLESTGDTAYTLMLGASTPLAAGARVVFGLNGDAGTNGGVTVDYVYTGLVLDAVDGLTLRGGAVSVDSVSWDATYPLVPGKSLNFGGTAGVDSNDDVANWCSASTPLGTDFGTPGAANDTCI